jgi:hypothetical protein
MIRPWPRGVKSNLCKELKHPGRVIDRSVAADGPSSASFADNWPI